jgi:hypothetical protein
LFKIQLKKVSFLFLKKKKENKSIQKLSQKNEKELVDATSGQDNGDEKKVKKDFEITLPKLIIRNLNFKVKIKLI